MVFIILGMHKSGTTLISQILHASGVYMGNFDHEINYDQGNKYENQEAVAINKAILKCNDTNSLQVIPTKYIAKIDNNLSSRIEKFVHKNKKFKNWGFKDPRTCLTFSIWNKFINLYRLVIVYRDPKEVWNHYQPKDNNSTWKYKLKISLQTLNAWYEYNHIIRKIIGDKSDVFIINYRNFMNSKESIIKLSQYLNTKLIDKREVRLYRNYPEVDWSFYLAQFILKYLFNKNIYSIYRKLESRRNV